MSGKWKHDYKKVFRAAINLLPSVYMQSITIDFEAAMWQALHRVLPTVAIHGCLFHWTQAVWRKAQELGLQVAYNTDNNTHKFIQKLEELSCLFSLNTSFIPTCWTHPTHLHQTSRKSSNSTSSRINHLHTVNMVEQHPLATYCLVSIWPFHQDKQWCGELVSPLKQEGQERSSSLLSSPVPAPWWSKTSQHPGLSDQWGKVNQPGKSKVQPSTIFSIQTLARLHQQHQNTITASQSMF